MIYMDNEAQKAQTSTDLLIDNSFFMLQEKENNIKCNTPELQRKNIFDMAKTTVDKMKNTVKVKRQELIDIMYSSHEANANEDINKY